MEISQEKLYVDIRVQWVKFKLGEGQAWGGGQE